MNENILEKKRRHRTAFLHMYPNLPEDPFESIGLGAAAYSGPNERAKEILREIESAEERTHVSLEANNSTDEYIALLSATVLRHSQSFANIKSVMLNYIRYLADRKALLPCQEEIFSRIQFEDVVVQVRDENARYVYHKDLQALRQAIEESVKLSKCYDPSVYDVVIAIYYLSWYGLKPEQMINLKKSDVSIQVSAVVTSGKIKDVDTSVAGFVATHLNRLKNAEGFYQMARYPVFRAYKPSEYLLRTERSEQLDINKLRSITKRFNSIAYRKFSLTHEVVYRSGIYNRIYHQMQSAEDPARYLEALKSPANAQEVSALFREELVNGEEYLISKHQRLIREFLYYCKLYHTN